MIHFFLEITWFCISLWFRYQVWIRCTQVPLAWSIWKCFSMCGISESWKENNTCIIEVPCLVLFLYNEPSIRNSVVQCITCSLKYSKKEKEKACVVRLLLRRANTKTWPHNYYVFYFLLGQGVFLNVFIFILFIYFIIFFFSLFGQWGCQSRLVGKPYLRIAQRVAIYTKLSI